MRTTWIVLASFLSFCALAVAVAVPSALATTPTTVVGIGQCTGGDAVRTVPAGAEIILQIPWGAKTRGQSVDFLHDVTTSVLIDGVPVANTDSFWSQSPQFFDFQGFGTLWWSFWQYPTGVVLDSGKSLYVSPSLSLSHPYFDGFTHYPSGVIGTPGVCAITAG